MQQGLEADFDKHYSRYLAPFSNLAGSRFATPIERNRDRDAQRLLRRLIAPFVLRRTKSQVLDDLPPRTELIFSVVPDADEAAHYEALRRTAVILAEGGEAASLPSSAELIDLMRG